MDEIIIIGLLCIIILILNVSYSTFQGEGIPQIIHQTAPADESKWNPIWKPCQASWKENFPDWEYRMWTDEDLDELIKTKYSWFYPTYTGYPKNINRFDAARYFILYEHGGIYADMDYECTKNFEHLLPIGKACANESPWNHEKYQNALMASPPRHPYWEKVWDELEKQKDQPDIVKATGPEIIRNVSDANPDLFYALPRGNFAQEHTDEFKPNAKEPTDTLMKRPYTSDVYARHHSTASWQ